MTVTPILLSSTPNWSNAVDSRFLQFLEPCIIARRAAIAELGCVEAREMAERAGLPEVAALLAEFEAQP